MGTLQSNKRITHLAISGCKVKFESVLNFIERLPTTSLQVLIMDGFNYVTTPISWPKVADNTFREPQNFEKFLHSIAQPKSALTDIRVGFLELTQITTIDEFLKKSKSKRPFTISMQDFGRTGNCWVAQ